MRGYGIALAAALAAAAPASAQMITERVNFRITNLKNPFDSAILSPVDPVIGSVTITFDKSNDYLDSTDNIQLNNLNTILGSPIAFSYYSQFNYLIIGGLSAGTSSILGGTNDFILQFALATTPPVGIASFTYSRGGNWWSASGRDAVVEARISPAPEPATWASMLAGFALIGGTLRMRRRAGLFAPAA